MKTAEIKEMPTCDLVERVEAEVANYNQVILNHSISPLDNPAQIKQLPINDELDGSKKFKKRKNWGCAEQ